VTCGEAMDEDVVRARWEPEQALLGLARGTPDEGFALGGLARLAVAPTVRIVILPGDPCAVAVPPQNPTAVIPEQISVPGGRQLPRHGTMRGTSSGYVAVLYSGEDGPWRSFVAVNWHGGVECFLGDHGGHEWDVPPDSRRRVIHLQNAIGWAWAAFDLQRQMIERFTVSGPFRAIVAVARASGAILDAFGAGWREPRNMGFWDQPIAVEQHVLLVEDLAEWPEAGSIEALALRFGARLDLAFGGPGERHLDRTGPAAGKFRLQW
jgi:hypothetical protein